MKNTPGLPGSWHPSLAHTPCDPPTRSYTKVSINKEYPRRIPQDTQYLVWGSWPTHAILHKPWQGPASACAIQWRTSQDTQDLDTLLQPTHPATHPHTPTQRPSSTKNAQEEYSRTKDHRILTHPYTPTQGPAITETCPPHEEYLKTHRTLYCFSWNLRTHPVTNSPTPTQGPASPKNAQNEYLKTHRIALSSSTSWNLPIIYTTCIPTPCPTPTHPPTQMSSPVLASAKPAHLMKSSIPWATQDLHLLQLQLKLAYTFCDPPQLPHQCYHQPSLPTSWRAPSCGPCRILISSSLSWDLPTHSMSPPPPPPYPQNFHTSAKPAHLMQSTVPWATQDLDLLQLQLKLVQEGTGHLLLHLKGLTVRHRHTTMGANFHAKHSVLLLLFWSTVMVTYFVLV